MVNDSLVLPREAMAELGAYMLGIRNWIYAAQTCIEAP